MPLHEPISRVTIGSQIAVPNQVPKSHPSGANTFREILSSLGIGQIGVLHQQVSQMERIIGGGGSKVGTPLRELLLLQSRVSQLGLRVELVSKAAESALSTVKRFEQGV